MGFPEMPGAALGVEEAEWVKPKAETVFLAAATVHRQPDSGQVPSWLVLEIF